MVVPQALANDEDQNELIAVDIEKFPEIDL